MTRLILTVVTVIALAACADGTKPSLLDVTQLEDTADTVGPYAITAVARDDRGIDSVTLYYTAEESESPQLKAVVMENLQGDLYTGEIAGFPAGARVRYFVEAKDTSANYARVPAESGTYYTFNVISR